MSMMMMMMMTTTNYDATVVVVRSKAINHLHLAVVLMSTVGLSSLFSFIL